MSVKSMTASLCWLIASAHFCILHLSSPSDTMCVHVEKFVLMVFTTDSRFRALRPPLTMRIDFIFISPHRTAPFGVVCVCVCACDEVNMIHDDSNYKITHNGWTAEKTIGLRFYALLPDSIQYVENIIYNVCARASLRIHETKFSTLFVSVHKPQRRIKMKRKKNKNVFI